MREKRLNWDYPFAYYNWDSLLDYFSTAHLKLQNLTPFNSFYSSFQMNFCTSMRSFKSVLFNINMDITPDTLNSIIEILPSLHSRFKSLVFRVNLFELQMGEPFANESKIIRFESGRLTIFGVLSL